MLQKLFSCLALVGCLFLTGCGSKPATGVIDIPEDNPYQATPEDLEAYNARRAEESAAMRGSNN